MSITSRSKIMKISARVCKRLRAALSCVCTVSRPGFVWMLDVLSGFGGKTCESDQKNQHQTNTLGSSETSGVKARLRAFVRNTCVFKKEIRGRARSGERSSSGGRFLTATGHTKVSGLGGRLTLTELEHKPQLPRP